ncbi:MAG TPA: hypothetical protein VNW92_17515, partial [Polyangiaceae bacterium]|nr:hypothetical protein [Polyangiaceae bacterium]
MSHLGKLLRFALPYWKRSLAALLLLIALVFLDLSIPRLVQNLIDHGILRHDWAVVLRTSGLMLGISFLSV